MIILGLLMILFLVLVVAAVIIYFIGLWKVFQKAGKNGWEAIVPFYSSWILVEISGLAWWYAVIIIASSLGVVAGSTGIGALLSLAALVANYFVCFNLSKKFHQDIGFSVLMFFFSFVMIPILGFSEKYQYDAYVSVSENGPIDSNTFNSNNNTNSPNTTYYEQNNNQKRFCSYCGSKINDNANFCGNCGKEIK